MTLNEMISTIHENGGITLKKGNEVQYKTGYQVADYGVETTDLYEMVKAVMDMEGTCGVWYDNGVYYIDHSFRVDTKKEALAIGRAHNQISILKWSDMSLVYC